MCFLSLCRLALLTRIIFLLSEELLLTFLGRQVCWQHILGFGARRSFSFTFSPSIFKCKLYWIQNSRLMGFLLNALNIILHSLPACTISSKKSDVFLILVSCLARFFFPLLFPPTNFLPVFDFLQFKCDLPSNRFLEFILVGIHVDSNYLELLALGWDNFLQCFL